MAITQAYRAGHDGRSGWLICFGYDESLIDALKRAVPPRDRSYDPATHAWWFAEEQADAVERVLPDFAAYRAQIQLL